MPCNGSPMSRGSTSMITVRATGLWCAAWLSLGARTVAAQTFQLSSADVADSAALTKSMPRLAAAVLATYRDTTRARFLDNLFRLQILTGRYREAAASLAEGRALRTSRQDTTPQAHALYVQYEIFARAKSVAESGGRPFPETFAALFRETFARLDDRTAVLAAANGYVGVTGHTRGKACSPDKTVPYVYDGADAAALIDWIAAQPWSDGRVGMYGGSYSGFTAWAGAKHMPKALKAIMVGAPVAPGVDVPMEGNVFWNFVYPWPFYTTNTRWLDNATYNENGRWNRLSREWYRSGRPYRDLEKIDGTANPGFAAWLAHPAVDAYWRATIPQDSEYANITIPVLQTAGYFYGGPGGAVYYFLQHYKYNPRAIHYLLIGPYDHLQAQRGVVTPLGDTATYLAGYEIDPVARIDIAADLRYQWFDYVLKGGPKPALLRDRVNYQVMGANVWKHAPSIAAASNSRLRLYLSPARSGAGYTLLEAPGPKDPSITHTVNLADRSDVDVRTGGGIVDATIDTSNGITLVSEPLAGAVELSGLMSGHLELITNKRDFDFIIALYELAADGQYFQLPPYTSRASHVGSVNERRLLMPGKLKRLDFASSLRMMSRRLGPGSRLVMVLSVVKNPRQQINYGTGKDVSDESIADAGEPLIIRWFAGSYIELPVRR